MPRKSFGNFHMIPAPSHVSMASSMERIYISLKIDNTNVCGITFTSTYQVLTWKQILFEHKHLQFWSIASI